jgi:hypothetical protein
VDMHSEDERNENEDAFLQPLSQSVRITRARAKQISRLPSSSPPPATAGPSSNPGPSASNAGPSTGFSNSMLIPPFLSVIPNLICCVSAFALLNRVAGESDAESDNVPTRPTTPVEDVVSSLSSTFSSQLVVGASHNPWASKRSAGFAL